jgi:RNA polymerase sigma-70 factor (ECF subfamily)
MSGLPDRRSDDELLAAGDAQSFAVFYRRHVDWMLGYLQRRTRDPELAADLTAEVFAAALLARRRYEPRGGHANSWLFGIALHKLADSQRRGCAADRARRRLRMERVAPTEEDRLRIEALGREIGVMQLVNELPDEQRTAVLGRVVEDRGYAEMAASAGVSEVVMRKRVSRGLASVRARIGGLR